MNIFSVIYTYTPTQTLSFNPKNEITLLYSFKPVHTRYMYIYTHTHILYIHIYINLAEVM